MNLSKKHIYFIVFLITISIAFALFQKEVIPEIKMVSGTEYISGETGQVIARITDNYGVPISDAKCFADVLYPDKNYFLYQEAMIESTTKGNFYKKFTTPEITGIYEYTITCKLNVDDEEQTVIISSSYHVSVALNYVIELSKVERERYEALVLSLNSSFNDILVELEKKNEIESIRLDQIEQQLKELDSDVKDNNKELNSDFAELGEAFTNIFG